MRESVDDVASYRDDYLSVVMDTFVWPFPHRYRAAAAPGSAFVVDGVALLAGACGWNVLA